MKLVIVCVCIFFAFGRAAADPLAVMYSADDPLYDAIEMLSVESGVLPPSSASPWSGYELYRHLQKIDGHLLSGQGRKLYKETLSVLQWDQHSREYRSSLRVHPEIYGSLNRADEPSYDDFAYDIYDRPPFLYLDADGFIGDWFYGVFSAEARKLGNEMVPEGGEQNLGFAHGMSNILFSPDDAEHAFPYTAFAGLSFPQLTLAAGRDALSWGRGNTGNLLIGGHAPYHDFVSFGAQRDVLSYRFLAMPIDQLDDEGKSEGVAFTDQKYRLFTAHRLEARISPRLAVSLTEGALFFSDRGDIRMFSPMMFLHNYRNYTEMKNFFHIDVDFVITPGRMLYSQLFIDQIQIPAEIDGYDDGDLFPNAFGAIAGIEFVEPVGEGYLTGYLEAAFTSTYLYLRRNVGDDNGDEIDSTEYFTDHWNLDLIQGTGIRGGRGENYIGYRYGPDSFVSAAKIEYSQRDHFNIFGMAELKIRGEQGREYKGKEQLVDTGEDYLYQLWPSGDADYRFTVGLGGSYQVPESSIALDLRIHGINQWLSNEEGGYEHRFDVQTALGARLTVDIL